MVATDIDDTENIKALEEKLPIERIDVELLNPEEKKKYCMVSTHRFASCIHLNHLHDTLELGNLKVYGHFLLCFGCGWQVVERRPVYSSKSTMTSSNESLFSALLSPITGNFPHKGPVTRTLMFLWCESAQAVKQTAEWSVIWDYPTFMWRHRNAILRMALRIKLPGHRWPRHWPNSGIVRQWGWFNTKMSSCQYWNFHCGDKTIFRPSYL